MLSPANKAASPHSAVVPVRFQIGSWAAMYFLIIYESHRLPVCGQFVIRYFSQPMQRNSESHAYFLVSDLQQSQT